MKHRIGLGGGCHWCTEAIFQQVKGVEEVLQGWIASDPPADTYSEAVIVTYDASKVHLQTLVEIHLQTHSCTSNHELRSKYRSAIYYFSKAQYEEIQMILEDYQTRLDLPLVTQSWPFRTFKKNQEKYIDYYRKNPNAAFCQRYIVPKLQSIQQIDPSLVNKNESISS